MKKPKFPVPLTVFLSQKQADKLKKIKEGRRWSYCEIIRRSLENTFKLSVFTNPELRAKQDKINKNSSKTGGRAYGVAPQPVTDDEGANTFAKADRPLRRPFINLIKK